MILLYINNTGKNISHSHIRLFTDNCLLYIAISSDKKTQIKNETQLQSDLTTL